MPVRLAIVKSTASGEQITFDICQWNPVTGEIVHEDVSEMCQIAEETLKLGDVRAMEMQVRSFEAYGLREHMTPEEWSKVVSIIDILSGRDTADNVARRWYSAKEETAELARMREEYAAEQAALVDTAEKNGTQS